MPIKITRGSTPTINMRPLNNILVSDLGEPAVAIVQDMVFINPDVTVDTANNCITFSLSEEDTMQLVAGIEANIQEIWKDQNDQIIRFPVHAIEIEDTLLARFDDVASEDPIDDPGTFVDEEIQIPDPEDEDELEEPERPLIWDEEEEDSDVEVDEDFGEYQIYDESEVSNG